MKRQHLEKTPSAEERAKTYYSSLSTCALALAGSAFAFATQFISNPEILKEAPYALAALIATMPVLIAHGLHAHLKSKRTDIPVLFVNDMDRLLIIFASFANLSALGTLFAVFSPLYALGLSVGVVTVIVTMKLTSMQLLQKTGTARS